MLITAATEPAITISANGEVGKSMTTTLINALKASYGQTMQNQTSEQHGAAKWCAEIFGKHREATKLYCELYELLMDLSLLQKKEI
jgi:hypothetical protein